MTDSNNATSFSFRWIQNSKWKHSLTFYSFSIRFLWRLTALAANADEELWKHRKKIKFLTGLLWNLCIFIISSLSPLLSDGEVSRCFVCLLWKFILYFERNIFFLWKIGISPVYWSLTSACTTVTSIKWLLLFCCIQAGFWCPLQWYKSRAIYWDLNLTSVF